MRNEQQYLLTARRQKRWNPCGSFRIPHSAFRIRFRIRHSALRTPHSEGFTLLEVMLAVALFAVATTSIYMVFRTGLRAYDAGIKTGDLMQTGRFAMDILSRDLKNVYLLPESAYNVQYRRRLMDIEQQKQQLEQHGMGNPEELAKRIEEFDKTGQGIDLSLRGSGGDGGAEISFVRYQSHNTARAPQPLNLCRVRYWVQDQTLMRSEEDVYKADLDSTGEPVEQPAPEPEALVRGVQSFDVLYGFYYDGQWLETTTWDSKQKQDRTDMVDLEWEDDLIRPNLEQAVNQYEQYSPDDNLPGYIRVRVAVADPRGQKRPQVFARTINMAAGQESHIPLPEELTLQDKEGKERRIKRDNLVKLPEARLRSDRLALQSDNERPRLGQPAHFYVK
ncbi:MAG: prepilin-type N-terminal cleavage/methylation domain-containing protein [Candidatus Sumerlaeota bacterium]|nr:prepilin-type N-terminal cleavage/methylation domain-containing protein [Candidatus Sumerlaeota bacterium]